MGGVLIASACVYEAGPVLMCGIIVGGSAFPITLKAYRRRVLRKAEIDGGDLERLLERRFAEFEDRNFQYMNEMEDRAAERIEAVEERIDYTERMLARRSEVYVPDDKPFRGLPMVTPI